jgi:hypothetical protein
MTPALIAAYGTVDKLVSHLHLPVQSGSDRVLAAMKRGYTALEYKSIVRRLRAVRPGLSLTSDFIVGFPGETDADFERTLTLAAEVHFDGAFTFAYSPRPGTPAAGFRPGRTDGSRRASKGSRRPRRAVPRVQRGRWSAPGSACSSPAAPWGRAGAGRAPRTTASSISLAKPSLAPIRRRDDFPRPGAAFAAGRACGASSRARRTG